MTRTTMQAKITGTNRLDYRSMVMVVPQRRGADRSICNRMSKTIV